MNTFPTYEGDEGLGLHDLKLVPPNPHWSARYKLASEQLRSVPHLVSMEHIGSTVFDDVQSKPVIDIAIMVDGQPSQADVKDSLQKAGYISHGEYGLPGRQFFTLGEPPVVHLHVVTCGSSYWTDWLLFRDYLKTHPERRVEYEKEKLRIADVCKGDRQLYTKMKSTIIQSILHQARSESR